MWSRALQKHRDCINGFGWSVMHMTLKEQIILNHYKTIIEKRAFDEYDILGFLVFIRAWVTNDGVIREFCDLIAHRERNQGRVMRCIEGAIKNDYECIAGSKKVKGYHGIEWADWKNAWDSLGGSLGICFSDKALQEMTLCIFSLAQGTKYRSGQYAGTVCLFQASTGQISLTTTEGTPHSLFVCFMILEGISGQDRAFDGMIDQPVETFRENGILHLQTDTGAMIV